MTTFSSFSDLLPDPNNKINSAGVADNTNGDAGPGFAKVKFGSDYQTQVSRTISGRGVTASPGYHMWNFSISYNPMTRDEFEPVASFLESRYGRLKPFYVILPQHSAPRNAAFETLCRSNLNGITVSGIHGAGTPYLMINGVSSGTPMRGDFITISDPADVNHKKAYKIIRVEDNSTYQIGTTQPSSTQRRVWLEPALSRTVSSNSVVNFIDPKFRVIQKGDTFEYDLDTDGLYQFSLSLEEILP